MSTRFFPNYNANKITFRFGKRTLNGTTIQLTLLPSDGAKEWVVGSTFELWGVRA